MPDKIIQSRNAITRRSTLLGIGAAAGAGLAAGVAPGFVRYSQAQTSAPIRIGMQLHRTGIGASYGRWYERTALAAVKVINEDGGINGRPLELVIEDDGTDVKRGAEVVEKFATQHRVDAVYGALFSHVVIGSAPRAGELKMPYIAVSEGTHIPSGSLNRYCFQPCITDVRSQVTAMAPWVSQNLGKKVTMIFPDYAFGHDHRDYFSAAIKAQGGEIAELIPIPPTEKSFTRYFPRIPSDTDVLYHVMIGPSVLTFATELGQFYGSNRPEIFGFIDSIEAVDLATPQLSFLEGTYFWEGMPRYAQENQSEWDKFYRAAVGVDDNGASTADPRDISTYAHMFGCWESLFFIKQAMEAANYQGPQDKAAFIEAMEAIETMPESREYPQGDKIFNGKNHQCYGHQFISKVENGRLNVVHKTSIEDGAYEVTADYTQMAL
ncbi:ABC transporter substrate-binding protein [Rhizobiaceae bacterium BDR2-2]|uniref:ABC transporter substrate-binding protein n=1 Tax=Ectorhizobium quercum TaxID=2965071 RepID=A0AAE3SV53_9HYPH|nr:ABC transporter substrate-binding protein [Ectorhizobium quercum]MCX8997970.1 ABC transporter substrate-binding protein [Ectorhizobium quercum]